MQPDGRGDKGGKKSPLHVTSATLHFKLKPESSHNMRRRRLAALLHLRNATDGVDLSFVVDTPVLGKDSKEQLEVWKNLRAHIT